MSTVSIKKGLVNMKMDRNAIVNIEDTSDGIIFNFKDCYFYVIDMSMPLQVKRLIKTSFDGFTEGNIEIDLNNYMKPVKVVL